MSDVVNTQVRSPRTARATTGRMRAEARFIGFVTRKIWRYDNQLRFCLAVRDQTSAAAAVEPAMSSDSLQRYLAKFDRRGKRLRQN